MLESLTRDAGESSHIHRLDVSARHLVKTALSSASRKMYIQAWKAFAEWCPSKVTFPTAPHVMCNYIGFLSLQHLAPRTISTRISALGYFHRLFDVQDPTAAFLVKKALRGVHTSTQYANDPRLPITKAILHQLLSAIDKVEPILNNRLLLKAFFLVTFYCCLRIGELAATKIHRSKVIQRQDVVCMKSGTEVCFHHNNSKS